MPRDFRFVGGPERVAAVRSWLADGAPDRGVTPRAAATVLLLRDTASGPEVVMLKRAATMAFAASMHAFPGGSVDDRDTGVEIPTSTVDAAASALRVGQAEARRHLAAAVREILEETGIVIDPSTLRVRGRWVTPVFDPRRFDTWILAARVPDDQQLRHLTSEAVTMEWVHPQQVLDAFAKDEVVMLPPTVHALTELVSAGSSAAFLELPADPRVIVPRVVDEDGALVLRVDP